MKTERSFNPMTERYAFDFKTCSCANGFAQVDTSQDASYFGTWANPITLQIVTFCEGDITKQTAETTEEFAAELRHMKQWNDESGHRFIGIDPGFSDSLKAAFVDAGLEDLLH